MIVLVWHASLRANRYLADRAEGVQTWYSYFPHGEVGVLLFFFISGIVVSRPFLGRSMRDWGVLRYYKKRFIRIYPPYLTVMITCFVILGIFRYSPTDANSFNGSQVSLGRSFQWSAAFLHGAVLGEQPRLNPPMWSLEMEVGFYVVLPAILFVYQLVRSPRVRIGTLTAVILVIALVSAAIIPPGADLRFRWGLLSHSVLFLSGIIAADISVRVNLHSLRRSIRGDFLLGLGLGLLLGVGYFMTQTDAKFVSPLHALGTGLITIAGLGLIAVGSVASKFLSRFLLFRPMQLLGAMCFSVYLTHIIVMTAAGAVLRHLITTTDPVIVYPLYLVALISASVVVGLFYYIAVERPFATWASSNRSGPRPGPPATTTSLT